MVVLKKEGLRLISNHCDPFLNNWGLMALNKVLHSTGFFGYSSLSEANESHRLTHKVWIDIGGGSIVSTKCGLSLKGCLDRYDGSAMACAMAENRHFICGDEVGLKLVNGNGSCNHGRPLSFPNGSMSKKMMVAVDVDEVRGLENVTTFHCGRTDKECYGFKYWISGLNISVLGSFLSALNKFIADRYSLNHSVSEYFVYEFFRIWNCSRAEAAMRVHEFFRTHYFTAGIHPIPGAQYALHNLSTFCNLSIVTSRQNVIKDHTLKWIEKHYPGLFQEIHFGNHFALDGQSKPKSEICRSLGAQVLIDDNPRYALECAEVGIRVLLFDYDNSYPWSKSDVAASHPLVTKVHNWEEVEKHLISWAIS